MHLREHYSATRRKALQTTAKIISRRITVSEGGQPRKNECCRVPSTLGNVSQCRATESSSMISRGAVGGEEGEDSRGQEETSGVIHLFLILTSEGFTSVCPVKFIKPHSLNTCLLVCQLLGSKAVQSKRSGWGRNNCLRGRRSLEPSTAENSIQTQQWSTRTKAGNLLHADVGRHQASGQALD